MRLKRQRDGVLSMYFHMINENKKATKNTSLKQIPINNHTEPHGGLIRGNLLLEDIFGFYNSFRKLTEGLGIELEIRTSNRKQDILYKTLGDSDVNVTFNNNNLNIPTINPSPKTETIVAEAITKSCTLSYEFWTIDRKPVDTATELQADISTASNINFPLYLIEVHQKTQEIDPAAPAINLSKNGFVNAFFLRYSPSMLFTVKKNYSEFDGIHYLKGTIMINYNENI